MWRDKSARSKPQDDEASRSDAHDASSSSEDDDEARLFYERLEQTGRLVDVSDATDLSTLDPRVTHVRHPDGTIERIGYT